MPNSANLNYYETMAEAMENLKSEKVDNGMPSLAISQKLPSTQEQEKLSQFKLGNADAEDLYSLNKSLYNSSKLFPPTERDFDSEFPLTSLREKPKKIQKYTSHKQLSNEKPSLKKFGTRKEGENEKKFLQESISFVNVRKID